LPGTSTTGCAYRPITPTSTQLSRTVSATAKHSGSIAGDGAWGRWSYGASLAYVGSHLDRREVAPFDVVRLQSYWLAGARVAYAVRSNVELFARGSNLLDAHYEDSAGYRTEGRGLYLGIRLADRRSSP
jgi:outer membrane cobalamin receptor